MRAEQSACFFYCIGDFMTKSFAEDVIISKSDTQL